LSSIYVCVRGRSMVVDLRYPQSPLVSFHALSQLCGVVEVIDLLLKLVNQSSNLWLLFLTSQSNCVHLWRSLSRQLIADVDSTNEVNFFLNSLLFATIIDDSWFILILLNACVSCRSVYKICVDVCVLHELLCFLHPFLLYERFYEICWYICAFFNDVISV